VCENRKFVVPVNILTPFVTPSFSWGVRHTTVCLDIKFCQTRHDSCFDIPAHPVSFNCFSDSFIYGYWKQANQVCSFFFEVTFQFVACFKWPIFKVAKNINFYHKKVQLLMLTLHTLIADIVCI